MCLLLFLGLLTALPGPRPGRPSLLKEMLEGRLGGELDHIPRLAQLVVQLAGDVLPGHEVLHVRLLPLLGLLTALPGPRPSRPR